MRTCEECNGLGKVEGDLPDPYRTPAEMIRAEQEKIIKKKERKPMSNKAKNILCISGLGVVVMGWIFVVGGFWGQMSSGIQTASVVSLLIFIVCSTAVMAVLNEWE